MCGLPTLRANLIKARSYSERMFRGQKIDSLSPPHDREAFEDPLIGKPMRATPGLVEKVLTDVAGYPFFIQMWGAELWDAAQQARVTTMTLPLLRAIEVDIYKRLDADFYAGRLDALTPAEQDLLMSMCDCPYPPITTAAAKQVAKSRSAKHVEVLLGRLVSAGILYRVRQGAYECTAPQFHRFLLRHRAAQAQKVTTTTTSSITTASTPGYETKVTRTRA